MSDRTVAVPRTEICDLVGLPYDTIDAELNAAIESTIARQRQVEQVAAAEANALDEDARLVNAAVADCRIPAARAHVWVAACARDRVETRSVLASLLPGFAPAPTAAAAGIERSLSRLGVTASLAAPACVAAAKTEPALSSAPVQYSPHVGQSKDINGQIIDPMPAPVLLSKGKPVSEWTADDKYGAFAQALGPAFSRGAPKPPPRDAYFLPSANAVSEPIVGADGVVTGWQANANYRPQG